MSLADDMWRLGEEARDKQEIIRREQDSATYNKIVDTIKKEAVNGRSYIHLEQDLSPGVLYMLRVDGFSYAGDGSRIWPHITIAWEK